MQPNYYMRQTVFMALGELEIFLTWTGVAFAPADTSDKSPGKPDETVANYRPAHLQYLSERFVFNLNHLSRAISTLDSLVETGNY